METINFTNEILLPSLVIKGDNGCIWPPLTLVTLAVSPSIACTVEPIWDNPDSILIEVKIIRLNLIKNCLKLAIHINT